MQTFSTPAPVDLAVNVQVGDIAVIATERTDTVVSVAPSSSEKAGDVRAAENTRVEFDGGRVTIVGPRAKFSWFGPSESVDLVVEVPTGSRFTAEISVGAVRSTGSLGATRVKSSTGAVDLESVGDLWLYAGHGSVHIGDVDGRAEVTADHGQIRIDTLAGEGVLKASHGSVTVGETHGGVEANLSYGDIGITRALGSVAAKTAYGSVDIGEVSGGSIDADSGYGQITIGIRADTPTWLDLSSKSGRVRNQLPGAAETTPTAPGRDDARVTVRARTRYGDIEIRRAQ